MTSANVHRVAVNPIIPLIESLMAASGAEAGLHYSMVWDADEGRNRFYKLQPVGPRRFVDAFMRYDGIAVGDLLGDPLSDRFDAVLDTITDVLRFHHQRIDEMPPMLAVLWREAGVCASVGTNVFADSQYLGWIGVFSQQALDASTLNASLPAVLSGLRAAEPRTPRQFGGTDDAAIVDAEGRCLRASAETAQWLAEPAVHTKLGHLLLRLRETQSSMSGRIGLAGRLVQLLLIDDQRAAVMFCRQDVPRLLLIQALTPNQRAIAARAAGGGTADEIALALGLSVDTVHDQLKAIYDRLGIASQAELAAEVSLFVN